MVIFPGGKDNASLREYKISQLLFFAINDADKKHGKPQVNSKGGRSLALRKGWHAFEVKQISNFIGGWNSQHRNNGTVSMRKYGTDRWDKITEEQIGFVAEAE